MKNRDVYNEDYFRFINNLTSVNLVSSSIVKIFIRVCSCVNFCQGVHCR